VVLIDTSVWIDVLRHAGTPSLRAELATLMEKKEAAWCAAVRLELWTGIRGCLG
jgi:predicted nucleic acid-binding protein